MKAPINRRTPSASRYWSPKLPFCVDLCTGRFTRNTHEVPIAMSQILPPYLTLIIRYVVSVPVAFFVSFSTCLALAGFMPDMYGSFFCVFVTVGFMGVFCGAICLPPHSRGIGAFILLLVGLLYYRNLWRNIGDWEPHPAEFPHFAPLLTGGLVAAIGLSFWQIMHRPKAK